jgi:hypothetical protein
MEHALDQEILDFCKCQNIVPSVDETSSDSDSSPPEEEGPECLDTFEEIVNQSDLNKFSTVLKEAQWVALAAERAKPSHRPYTGHLRSTKYRRKKLRIDLASKGFLPINQFMKWAEAKRQAARSQALREESEESSDDVHEIHSSTLCARPHQYSWCFGF